VYHPEVRLLMTKEEEGFEISGHGLTQNTASANTWDD
jgi:hypothetical protein